MNLKNAKEIALSFITEINKNASKYSTEVTLCENIEKFEFVYVFYYNSVEFIKTGELSELLLGPGPCLIDKNNGMIINYGSAYSSKEAVKDYYDKKGYVSNDDLSENSDETIILNPMDEKDIVNILTKKFKTDSNDNTLSQDEADRIIQNRSSTDNFP